MRIRLAATLLAAGLTAAFEAFGAPVAPGDANVPFSTPSRPARPAGVDAPTDRAPQSVTGEWNCLILLVDFPDYPWTNSRDPYFANADSAVTYPAAHFQQMLFSDGTYRDPWAASAYTGSMRDFYSENSYNAFSVTGTVTQWFRAPHPYRYYCNTDGIAGTTDDFGWAKSDSGMVWDLVRDAVNVANATVDFSQFDNDGNGVVDGLFIVHAGPGAEAVYATNAAAGAAYLWSHKLAIPQVTVDGVKVTNYTLEPEDGKVGVFCHEFGHELGLPDLYDVDGTSEGLGEWDVMGSGGWCFRPGDAKGTCPSHFSAWSKQQLGWITPVNVTAQRIGQTIVPVETAPVAYRLWTNGAAGTEYFLVENRQNIGFDAGLTRRQRTYGLAAANGLLIYHVDDAVPDNTNESHKRIDVEESTPYWTGSAWYEQLDHTRLVPLDQFLANGNRGDNGDPWPGYASVAADGASFAGARSRDAFSAASIPNSNSYAGAATGVTIQRMSVSGVNVIADLYTSTPTAVEPADHGTDPSAHAALDPLLSPVRPSVARSTVAFGLTPRGESPVRVVIVDSEGRVVRRIAEGVSTARTLRWDLRDDVGRDVPAGVYVVRAEGADRRAHERVCVLR